MNIDIEYLTELVNAQAEDEGLWFVPETVIEAHLQKQLRKLHYAVESALGRPDLLRSKEPK